MSMSAVMGDSRWSANERCLAEYISRTMIGEIRNIRFIYQSTSATVLLSEHREGRLGSLASRQRPRCAGLLSTRTQRKRDNDCAYHLCDRSEEHTSELQS